MKSIFNSSSLRLSATKAAAHTKKKNCELIQGLKEKPLNKTSETPLFELSKKTKIRKLNLKIENHHRPQLEVTQN